MGVGASVGITALINSVSSGADWPVVVSIPAAIVAMIFAAFVGVVFGLYPHGEPAVSTRSMLCGTNKAQTQPGFISLVKGCSC